MVPAFSIILAHADQRRPGLADHKHSLLQIHDGLLLRANFHRSPVVLLRRRPLELAILLRGPLPELVLHALHGAQPRGPENRRGPAFERAGQLADALINYWANSHLGHLLGRILFVNVDSRAFIAAATELVRAELNFKPRLHQHG